jgi:hypothetical protein
VPCLLQDALDARAHALVGADVERPHAHGTDVTGGRSGGAIHNEAVFGQPFRNRSADPCGRACHECGRHALALLNPKAVL